MSSAMVGNGYPPNYNTYNSQPSPSHGQNLQEGYYDPHPSSRPPANEQQHYRSSPSQPHSVQTTPRRGVFYRLVSPDGGLPLGQYEEQRKYLDEQRQRDYLKMMSQKEKQEYQKREEEKVQKQVRDQKAQMQKQEQEKKLYNYNKVQKQFQEERSKDYEEFVKMKEEQAKYKQPPTPPGGLNVGHYELYRKRLKEDLVNEYQASLKQQQKEKIQLQLAKAQQEYSSNLAMKPPASPLPVKQVDLFDPEKTRQVLRDDRHKDYNDFLLEKEKNPSPRRAPTPPNGLDIVTQDERTRMAREKQRQYGQELQRDMIPDLHLESFRKDPMLDRRKEERNREYNKFLDEEHNREQQRREKLENLRKQPAVQPKYDNYSNSDNHERHRHNLESERRGEYQSFLSKNQSSREPSQEVFRRAPEFGLPLDNRKSNELRRQQEKDRNQDYRKFLEGQKQSPRRYHPPTPEEKQGLPLTQKPYDDKKAVNEKQRNMEYNQYLAKSGLPYDKMSLKGSAQQSSRQANGHHSGMEPRPPMKRHPSKKHDREVAQRLEEEKKKKGEVPRRQGDPSVDEKNMFSDMGKAQEAHSRRMQENARQDYKNYVDHAFPEGLNRGQPSFAAGKQPPDSWYSAQPPTHRYSPPRDFGPEQNGQKSNDPYTERLQQARANEAMYRRHDHEMNGQSQRAPPPRQEAPYALH